jgi:DNA-binding GntR family transcriptional regulator
MRIVFFQMSRRGYRPITDRHPAVRTSRAFVVWLTYCQIVSQYAHMTDDLQISAAAAPLRREIEMRLRAAIVDGRFRPGDRLIEREMCNLLGVSRASLREALRQLEAEELVTIIPHRGPVVSAVTVEEAEQLYDVRAMLEGLAARRFAEMASDEDIAVLRQALKEFADVVRSKSSRSLLSAKSRFYEVLLERCGNRVAGRILTQLNNRVGLLRSTSMSQKGRIKHTLAEITLIVEAIERRDPERAWQATVDHVTRAAEVAINVLRQQQQDPSDGRRNASAR